MRDVVELAIKIADVDSVSGAETVDTAALYGGRYEDIPRRIPDSTKAQRELGWRLQVDVEEGIRRTIDWARANPWYLKEPAGDRREPLRSRDEVRAAQASRELCGDSRGPLRSLRERPSGRCCRDGVAGIEPCGVGRELVRRGMTCAASRLNGSLQRGLRRSPTDRI